MSCALSIVLPIHVVRFWATVEGGEEAGEMGGGGGGKGSVPTVALLVEPGIGECAGG